jgi:hypothetical protein
VCGSIRLVGEAVGEAADDVARAAEEQPPHARQERQAVCGIGRAGWGEGAAAAAVVTLARVDVDAGSKVCLMM